MRRILSSLFSLFTVVGGHFLNRRLDLGLLFFALLLLAPTISGLILPALWALEYKDRLWEGSLMYGVFIALVAMTVVLILSSVIVSYRKAAEAEARPPLGRVGMAAALLATLLSALGVYRIGVVGAGYIQLSDYDYVAVAHDVKDEAAPESPAPIRYSFFHEMVRYGGEWIPDEELEPMPGGDAYITGRIRFEERPVVGATLKLVFNDRYGSKEIATDEKGYFSLEAPEGEWILNRIRIDGWPDHPAGHSFTVSGGPNPALSESMYHEGPSFNSQGHPVHPTKTPEILPGLDLSINADVELQWPESDRQAVDPEKDRITWKALKGAGRYQLQLHRVERRGSSTSYYPIAWINTAATEVPMSEFQTISDDAAAENEYAVQVFAFDAKGELLAGLGRFMDERSVILQGRRLMATEDLIPIAALHDMDEEEREKEMEAVYRDKQRLKAAETLAKEGLTEPARILMERIKSRSFEERKLSVMGLILAGEGRCEEARAKFDAANKARGNVCFPEYFKKRCGEESE